MDSKSQTGLIGFIYKNKITLLLIIILFASVKQNIINKYQYYNQCSAISELFKYRLYDKSDEQLLCLHAAKALSCDMNPQFITMELLSHLQTYFP